MEKMDIYDIVKRVVGNIDPIGEFEIDSRAKYNLDSYLTLTNIMISDIIQIAYKRKCGEGSISSCGQMAHEFMINTLKEWVDEYINECLDN